MKVIKDTPKGTPKEDIVSYMEDKYPEMTSEFQKIQREQYELFLHKQHDYGPQNIAVGQMLVDEEEKRLSLMGIWFRINDKVERIKTILMRGDNGSLKGEGLVDSYSDISNYGVMAQVVARGKWSKLFIITNVKLVYMNQILYLVCYRRCLDTDSGI